MTEFQRLIISKIDALKATHLVVERADLDTFTADLRGRLDALQRQVAALQHALEDRRSDVRSRIVAALPPPAAPPIGRASSRASSGQLIDVKAVVHRTGLSRSTIQKLIRAGTFPPRVKIGFLTRWSAAAVDAWIQERITAASEPDGGGR